MSVISIKPPFLLAVMWFPMRLAVFFVACLLLLSSNLTRAQDDEIDDLVDSVDFDDDNDTVEEFLAALDGSTDDGNTAASTTNDGSFTTGRTMVAVAVRPVLARQLISSAGNSTNTTTTTTTTNSTTAKPGRTPPGGRNKTTSITITRKPTTTVSPTPGQTLPTLQPPPNGTTKRTKKPTKGTTTIRPRRPPRPVTQAPGGSAVQLPQKQVDQKVVVYAVPWQYFDNLSVETMVVAWILILSALGILATLALCGVRIYYRKVTEELLGEIRQENERHRLNRAQNMDSKVKHLEPVSDPITEQALYYPLGELLKEDAQGGVL